MSSLGEPIATAGSATLYYEEQWKAYASHPKCVMPGCLSATHHGLPVPGHSWYQNGYMDDTFPESLRDYCFTCAYWVHMTERDVYEGGAVIVEEEARQPVNAGDIEWVHYCYDPKQPMLDRTKRNSYPVGHGGRLFTIEYTDGTVVETNNLWYQGPIPEWLHSRFQVNAQFLENQNQIKINLDPLES